MVFKALGHMESLPILFVYIGWADRYDGTEPIEGDFSYFKKKSAAISEAHAFFPDSDGLYHCGVGRGQIGPKRLHVVFVARDKKNSQMKIVGLYSAARIEMDDDWAVATCKRAVLLPPSSRPSLQSWPTGMGLRRWAWRGGEVGKEHPRLRKVFNLLLNSKSVLPAATKGDRNPSDMEAEGFEGSMRRRFLVHRHRENKLRLAKIREALAGNQGRLVCEVPRCGFDFGMRYGEIGMGYAQVHHLKPLSSVSHKGVRNKLADLVVVCANCHVMIHKGGECRPLKNLIPE